ncbi:MAG: Hsp20/alpha crystallin family protein [Pseudonocardiaceae bacterium]
MALIRWDPWTELAALQRDVNDLFGRTPSTTRRAPVAPPIDAYQTEWGLRVRMELPGIRPEDIDISVHDRQLVVSGERDTEDKVEEGQWVRRERSYGWFQRAFMLPEGVHADEIKASFEHGVLQLDIPNPPERQPRKIQIGGQPATQQTVDVTETTPTSGQQE